MSNTNFTVQAPTFSSYSYQTNKWTTTFRIDLFLDITPSDASYYLYDIKYFYHPVGQEDSSVHWAWNGNEIKQYAGNYGNYTRYIEVDSKLTAGAEYIFRFELWYAPSSGYWNDAYVKTNSYSVYIKNPLIALWAWDNTEINSWNYINVFTHGSDLHNSGQALYSGNPTKNFKRVIWNDLIDWLVYVYKTATSTNRVASDFYPYGSTGSAYISLSGSQTIFTANNWNLMGSIANSVARVLGGSNFINTSVQRGDRVNASIFGDVTYEINRLIQIYQS